MPSPAFRVGSVILVVGAGSTGVWYLTNNKPVPLNKEDDYSTNYTGNKIGAKYGAYFLSSKNNQWEWERRFSKYKDKFNPPAKLANGIVGTSSTKASDKFGSVGNGYGDNTTTSLNKVCEAAYKAESSNLVDDENNANNKYFKKNIWMFCGLGEIVTVEDSKEDFQVQSADGSSGTKTAVGADANLKKWLVSAKPDDSKNDWFWKIRSETLNKSDIQGSNDNSSFKKIKDSSSNFHWTELKNACHAAYGKDSSTDTSDKNKTNAEKLCSIK